jgi:hypothetical protein
MARKNAAITRNAHMALVYPKLALQNDIRWLGTCRSRQQYRCQLARAVSQL